MPRVRLIVEYDGTGFSGWQVQPGARTVQEELTKALRLILREDIPFVQSAGRTDSGVHSRGQVVAFTTEAAVDLKRISFGVSSILRGELAVVKADIVPGRFHPRVGVLRKQYSYRILLRHAPPTLQRKEVWHIPVAIDTEQLHRELQFLLGEHDFSSFRAAGCQAKSPIKRIDSIDVSHESDLCVIAVRGKGFLKQMIRIIVGTAVDRVKGKLSMTMQEILDARDRTKSGITAPARGLTLDWIFYDETPGKLID
jgi:tRNA pseudouridine38-40 synthase